MLQVYNKMQSPLWSKQHHGANKPLYCPEDKKLRQKTGKMSSELINLIHFRSPFIFYFFLEFHLFILTFATVSGC